MSGIVSGAPTSGGRGARYLLVASYVVGGLISAALLVLLALLAVDGHPWALLATAVGCLVPFPLRGIAYLVGVPRPAQHGKKTTKLRVSRLFARVNRFALDTRDRWRWHFRLQRVVRFQRWSAIPAAEPDAAYVPLVGRIAAGGPILAEEGIEDVFPLPKRLVGDGTLFLLRVIGDSMINVAIADGDLVVIRQQPVAENGEIVAAMIGGEATVKMFKFTDGHVWLMPFNPAYAPIPGDDAIILGKVVAVLRRV